MLHFFDNENKEGICSNHSSCDVVYESKIASPQDLALKLRVDDKPMKDENQ